MTAAESVNLKKNLLPNPNPNPEMPLRYHDRTQHILPHQNSQLQTLLDDIKVYTDTNQMKINQKKTKVILFNGARNYDFFPDLTLDDSPLEVVEKVTLHSQK